MRAPRYAERSLAQVLPAVAASLGSAAHVDRLGLPAASQVAVIVVDGLGHQQLLEHPGSAPMLAEAAASQEPIDAAFPSTTPVGLATLTLGLTPGTHGFVGGTFLLPDFDCVLNPLRWQDDPSPIAVQPEPNLFRGMHGIEVHSHGPAIYAQSGMTRTLLHAAIEHPYNRFDAKAVTPGRRRLDYVYLPELDKAGHVAGPGSGEWRACLHTVEAIVAAVRRRVPSDGYVLVTADHGMIEVPDARRIDIDGAAFTTGVDQLAGEPRMRHLHTRRAPDVRERWARHLGDRARVLLRDEAIEAGLFGAVDEVLADRIGDVIAIAADDWALTSATFDPRVSGLRGLHGGLTEPELQVPAIVLPGVA